MFLKGFQSDAQKAWAVSLASIDFKRKLCYRKRNLAFLVNHCRGGGSMHYRTSTRKPMRRTVVLTLPVLIVTLIMGFGAVTAGCGSRQQVVTTPATVEDLFTNEQGMTFVYIQPGKFIMGSPKNEQLRDGDEKRHKVKLTSGFYLQTTEMTQGQWQAVMGDNPSEFINCGENCPVEQVSWNDVQVFIRRLNKKPGRIYRLPTEAEWEHACRAGTSGPFNTGDCLSLDQANYDGDFPLPGCPDGLKRKKTVPVKRFVPNAWGLYDMHGNVWEWCSDWYGTYHSVRDKNPVGPSSGSSRVFRGGGWGSGARGCRSADRNWRPPDFKSGIIGFRLAVNP